MRKLYIDIETYSSVDIKSCGSYKYFNSFDFEILMIAYALDDGPIRVLEPESLNSCNSKASEFYDMLIDPTIIKVAHNANFERNAFKRMGYNVSIDQWECTAVKSLYCGFPMSLEAVSKALNLEEKGKLSTGKALIRYFCSPCKPTKVNGGRTRNYPEHALDKWKEFIEYCVNDVEAEREIDRLLSKYELPKIEKLSYCLDQKINDTGTKIDIDFAQKAFDLNSKHTDILFNKMTAITNLDNPNSQKQLTEWLSEELGTTITSVAKSNLKTIKASCTSGKVRAVLNLREKTSKSSVKKYATMLKCAGDDSRARGLFQFYGANRTGRWAGRLVQVQNLRRTDLQDLDLTRTLFKTGDYDLLRLCFEEITDALSQLIRTALIPEEGKYLIVSDFSAIEARVLAWLAGEQWRLDVFKTHGKIYEASASTMFGVPIEKVTKGSELRIRGKIAELALGYQGGTGALKKMGGEKMGLKEEDMSDIVFKWRKANKKIAAFWANVDKAAKYSISNKTCTSLNNLIFRCDTDSTFTITLPSGRKLFYQDAHVGMNSFGNYGILYNGINQVSRKWEKIDTYGGKLVENITQAVARDVLAISMLRLDKAGYKIVMHVHDEVVCEHQNKHTLKDMCQLMAKPIKWAQGLPLKAEGYASKYYKKD